ncbi:hypothetical protein CDEST_15387 [Colletotrichum destructivum]|uniref:Uncharacterized protein n=1 Tax=Colletotrichum destructivum TaxID=34406 RepID=A0AAX4J463_9PEZI|nr:hypothetical protein CDEST_15387 [Colletotrichum destructivum]
MGSIAQFLIQGRLQKARLSEHASYQRTTRFPQHPGVRPAKAMIAREEPPGSSRDLMRHRKQATIQNSGGDEAFHVRSRFHREPDPAAMSTTEIAIASPRHVIECMRYCEPNISLECPEVEEFYKLGDEEVMKDEIWFALTPIAHFWNPNAAEEANRIVTNNRFDCLLVIGICRNNAGFNLHMIQNYCSVPTHEPWRLGENTLDRLLTSNDWIGIEDGLQPDRAHLAIGRVFHLGYRVLHRTQSAAEYQGIIVIGAYSSHYKFKLLRMVDRVILYEDVTTMLEFITDKPLRLS